MNLKNKLLLYKIINSLSFILWGLSGIITMASIINGLNGFFINIMVGFLFVIVAGYLFMRMSVVSKLFNQILFSNDKIQEISIRFFSLEFIFSIIVLLFGFLTTVATISRAYFEKLPIFG